MKKQHYTGIILWNRRGDFEIQGVIDDYHVGVSIQGVTGHVVVIKVDKKEKKKSRFEMLKNPRAEADRRKN